MHKILTATLAAGVMAAGVAQSATTTTTFAVTATVQSTCSATAAALAFGNYTPGDGRADRQYHHQPSSAPRTRRSRSRSMLAPPRVTASRSA